MVNDLLFNFLKEEIRLHTSLYKKRNFYSYPLTLFLFFTFITMGSIYIYGEIDDIAVGSILLNLFFIGGVMSGAFGLYAKDYLERKFGDFGRLFSNTMILPISLKKSFVTLAISDSIFYLFWFILPTILGYGFGNILMGTPIGIFRLFISAFIIFMLGLFITFSLSVIYERNKILFSLFFTLLILIFVYIYFVLAIDEIFIHNFYLTGNIFSFLYSILLIIFFGVLCYISVDNKFSIKLRKSREFKSFKFPTKINYYIFKDYIDLKRTGGLIGKPLFTVFLPSILMLFLFSTMEILSTLNMDIIFFSIILGTLGTQLLNSLISSDDFRYYRYIPVTLNDYIGSKIKLSFFICFILGFFILLFYTLYESTNLISDLVIFIKSLIVLSVLLIYNFTLSFYLTGLHPNENLMQSKIFLIYFILFVPLLFVSIMINVFFNNFIFYLIYLLLSIFISYIYYMFGLKKWDDNHKVY